MTGSEVMEETASEVNPRNEYSASQIKKWVYGEEEAPGKIVFLTFDDGPSLNNTPKVLDILKENGINATFFYYTRYSLEDEKEVVKRTINEGNSIGLHSNCHDYDLLYPDGSADIPFILEDLKNSIEIIRDIVPGFDTSVMRFPGGSKSWDNMDEAKRAVKEWGAESIDWTTMTGDAGSGNDDRSPEGLVGMMEHIMSYFPERKVEVVLMHDPSWNECTVDGLHEVIDYFRDRGYEFGIIR